MIQSFRCRHTRVLYAGGDPRPFRAIRVAAERSNRLEVLKGGRIGQYSIRINDQWRVCFVWTEAGPANVEIVDYH